MKTVLKVIYVVFIGVMAFIVYFGMNSTYVSQNYINALKEASEKASTEKQYDDLASCFSLFSTPIDKEKVVFADQNGQNATSVYASVNQFNCEYTNSIRLSLPVWKLL